MKTVMMSIAATALVLGLGLGSFAEGQPMARNAPVPVPVLVQGKDHPIVLARMVVTATALPDNAN